MTQWGVDVLFNPSKRHMDEEKQRLQATRPIVGDNSNGDRIDLISGKVTIKGKKSEKRLASEAANDSRDTDSEADGSEAS